MKRREILAMLFKDVPTHDLRTLSAAICVCDGILWATHRADMSEEDADELLFVAVCELRFHPDSAQESPCAS